MGKTNPAAHLKHLDNYFKLKGVPDEVKVNIAILLLRGEMSKDWVETMLDQVTDFSEFRQEFLKTWWSSERQSQLRCTLYHGQYNHQTQITVCILFEIRDLT
jgi:hypothetical protein